MAEKNPFNSFFPFESPNPLFLHDLLPDLQTVPDSSNFSTHSISTLTNNTYSAIPDGHSLLLFSKTNQKIGDSSKYSKNQKESYDKKKLCEKQAKYKWLANKEKNIQNSFQNYSSIISQIEISLQKAEQSV